MVEITMETTVEGGETVKMIDRWGSEEGKRKSLVKEDLSRDPVWVKFHDAPLVAYTLDGLSLITMQTGEKQKTTPSVGKKNASTSGNGTFSLNNLFEALNVENSVSEEVETGNKASTSGDSEDEIEYVDNEMASYLASKPLGLDIMIGIMKMEPDIKNMTLNEYLEYEAEMERRLRKIDRSKRNPTIYEEVDFNSFHRDKSRAFDYSYYHEDIKINKYHGLPPLHPFSNLLNRTLRMV
ncbi:hypothetical protein Tco_0267345 [Tanacetum coccineum]